MTCHQGFILIVLIAIIVAIRVIRDKFLFKSYCERIAELEGRTDEFRSLIAPEGGMNWFEIEHAGKLWRRYYLKFGDKRLTEIGNTLLRRGISSLLVMILLLIAIVYVKTIVCSV